eukprot:TRINITY_DN524_c0_g1_i1.p1 TRINITY_DN524_c0_g1~~TRINITY_DN524_c0_g1_i1.p1  ORF type:complete len:350 (+),score=53.94 TRINITY_DN524_c0_g1_i1:75-1052(+)
MAAMPVYCRPNGGDPVMVEMPPDATVADLAKAVEVALGRAPRLCFQGRELPLGATLADEGICAEAMVEEGLQETRWHPDHHVGATLGSNPNVATLGASLAVRSVVCSAPVTAPGQVPGTPPGFLFSVDRATHDGELRVGFTFTTDPSAILLQAGAAEEDDYEEGAAEEDDYEEEEEEDPCLCMRLPALAAGTNVRVAFAPDDRGWQCMLVHCWGAEKAFEVMVARSCYGVQHDRSCAVPAWGWVSFWACLSAVAVTLRWQSPHLFPACIPAPSWPTAKEISHELFLKNVQMEIEEERVVVEHYLPYESSPEPFARPRLSQCCALM